MRNSELAREVCDISRVLIEKGLVARTWGNTSARSDDGFFLITPSGRPYETLTPAEIVPVSMNDLSHEGRLKPSSEKNLHQAVYRKYSKVNAVIHTHQPFASSFAAARISLPGNAISEGPLKDKTVKCASYALPTTKKLAKAVAVALEDYGAPALFLANHGAVCWGESLNEVLVVAEALEQACENYILMAFKKMSGDLSGGQSDLLSYYIKKRREEVKYG